MVRGGGGGGVSHGPSPCETRRGGGVTKATNHCNSRVCRFEVHDSYFQTLRPVACSKTVLMID